MKKFISVSALMLAAAISTGCVGGTTYGTGTSHEEQTLKAVTNIFALRTKDQPKIDYTARPDLVMPAESASLPQPLEVEQSTSNADWPESPEQRIARVRGEAVEADIRSGEIPLEELLREKEGITVAKRKEDVAAARRLARKNSYDGNSFIDALKNGGDEEGKEARKRRAELAYSTGAKRKFLTEPPTEYRTPAATAVAGDLGYSKEELEEIEKKAAAEKKAQATGHWIE